MHTKPAPVVERVDGGDDTGTAHLGPDLCRPDALRGDDAPGQPQPTRPHDVSRWGLAVYGRAGRPCRRCATPIAWAKQGEANCGT